jgi:hypothetical protein
MTSLSSIGRPTAHAAPAITQSTRGEPIPGRTIVMTVLAAFVVLLAGCTAQSGPDPKNLLGQEVDPVYGTPVPGTPTINAPD